MQLNNNYLSVNLLKTRTGSVGGLASAENTLKTTNDDDLKKIAQVLKEKVFQPMTDEFVDETKFSYQEDFSRIDDSKIEIGKIDIENQELNLSCDVTLARYENGVLCLSISPDELCSSFDYDIDGERTYNASSLNYVMAEISEHLYNYFEADLLYIDDSADNTDLPGNLNELAGKVQYSQFIKLRAKSDLGSFDNPGVVNHDKRTNTYNAKLGNYPFARNNAGYYNEVESNQKYLKAAAELVEKSGLKAHPREDGSTNFGRG